MFCYDKYPQKEERLPLWIDFLRLFS